MKGKEMVPIDDVVELIDRAARDLDAVGQRLLHEQAVNVDRAVAKGNVGEVNRTIRAMAELLKDYRISIPLAGPEVSTDPFDLLLESILERPPVPDGP